MGYFPGLEEAQKAYTTLRTNDLLSASIHAVSAMAVIMVFLKFINLYRESSSNTKGHPDIKSYLDFIYQYAFFLLIIFALPHIIRSAESVFGLMETKLMSKLGSYPKQGFDVVKRDLAEFQTLYPEGISLWDPLSVILNYVLCSIVNVIVAVVYGYMCSFYALTRYMYLLMLEIVAPIAVICLLSKETTQYFFTWLKNMLICFLMLPAFMLSIAFGSLVNSAGILGAEKFTLLSLLFQICIQIGLIMTAKALITKLL